MMPSVKWRRGACFSNSSKTAFTIAGVNSFDESPYRPAMTVGSVSNGDSPTARAAPARPGPSTRGGGGGARAGGPRRAERGHHVEVERVARRAGLLGSVEYGNGARARRQRGEERITRERAVESYLEHADLLPAPREVFHRLVHRLGARAHDDDYTLGLRVPLVFEELVAAARQPGEVVHQARDDAWAGIVKKVRGLAGLEEDIGVLCGTAEHGPVGSQGASAVSPDGLFGDEAAQVVVTKLLDFRHLVRSAEAVEEVQERDARLKRGGVRNRRQVVHLLHRV